MIEPTVWIVTGLFSLVLQMVFFIKDDRTTNETKEDAKYKTYWHIAGGVLHVWMYGIMHRLFGVEWGLLMASLTWLIFDGCINHFALNRKFFYIGTTAQIDKVQQWFAQTLDMKVEVVSAILKIGFLIFSIYILIKHG